MKKFIDFWQQRSKTELVAMIVTILLLTAWVPFRCRNSWLLNESGEKGLDLIFFILVENIVFITLLALAIWAVLRLMVGVMKSKQLVSFLSVFLLITVINFLGVMIIRWQAPMPFEKISIYYNPNRACSVEPASILIR